MVLTWGGGGGTNHTLVIENVQLNCCCSFCVADACLSAGPHGAAADGSLIADLLLLMLLLLWMFLVLLLVVILLVLLLVLLLLVAGAVAGAVVGIFAPTECSLGTPLTPQPVHMAHTCQSNGRHKTPLT